MLLAALVGALMAREPSGSLQGPRRLRSQVACLSSCLRLSLSRGLMPFVSFSGGVMDFRAEESRVEVPQPAPEVPSLEEKAWKIAVERESGDPP